MKDRYEFIKIEKEDTHGKGVMNTTIEYAYIFDKLEGRVIKKRVSDSTG